MYSMHSSPAEAAATTCQRLMAERLELQTQLETQEARNQELERRLEETERGAEATQRRDIRDARKQRAGVRAAAKSERAASQPSGSRGNRKASVDASLAPLRTSARIQQKGLSQRASGASEPNATTVSAPAVVVNTAQRTGGFTHVFGDVLNLSTFSSRPVISPAPSVRAPPTPPVRTLPEPPASAPDASMDARSNDQPIWHMLLNDTAQPEAADCAVHARALAAHCNDVSHILTNDDVDSLCGAGFDDPLENFTMDFEPRSSAVVAPGGEPHSTLGPLPNCFERPDVRGGWGRQGLAAPGLRGDGGFGRPLMQERSLDDAVKELQLMLDGALPGEALPDSQSHLKLDDWAFGDGRGEGSRRRERALEMRASMSQVPERRRSFRSSWTSPARGSGGASVIPTRRQSTPTLSLTNPFGPTDPQASPMRKRRVSSRGQFPLDAFAAHPIEADVFEPSAFLNPDCKRRASSSALGLPEPAAHGARHDGGDGLFPPGAPPQPPDEWQPAGRDGGRQALVGEPSSLVPSTDTTFAPACIPRPAGALSDPFAAVLPAQHLWPAAVKAEVHTETGSDGASFSEAGPAGHQTWGPSVAPPALMSDGRLAAIGDKAFSMSEDAMHSAGALWVDDLFADESASKLDTSCLVDYER